MALKFCFFNQVNKGWFPIINHAPLKGTSFVVAFQTKVYT